MNFPHRVDKKWGYEIWFANDRDKDYCGKELYVAARHRFSYHFHKIKDEVFYLVSGLVLVEFGDDDNLPTRDAAANRKFLVPGMCFHVPAGLRHRVSAFSKDSRLIEVSTFHRDSDSYRVPGLEGGPHSEAAPQHLLSS